MTDQRREGPARRQGRFDTAGSLRGNLRSATMWRGNHLDTALMNGPEEAFNLLLSAVAFGCELIRLFQIVCFSFVDFDRVFSCQTESQSQAC